MLLRSLWGAGRSTSVGFGSDASYQNTAEFIGIVVGLLGFCKWGSGKRQLMFVAIVYRL